MNAIGYGVERGVAPSDGESGVRNFRGVDRGAGQLFCEGDRDASGAGADVGDFEAFATECLLAAGANFAGGEAVERDFDDVFGFRAGNQDLRRDLEFESPEFLLTGEVLRRFSSCSTRDEREKPLGVFLGNCLLSMRVEPSATAAQ